MRIGGLIITDQTITDLAGNTISFGGASGAARKIVSLDSSGTVLGTSVAGAVRFYTNPAGVYLQSVKVDMVNRNPATAALVGLYYSSGSANPVSGDCIINGMLLYPNESKHITLPGINKSGDALSVQSDSSGVAFVMTAFSGTSYITQGLITSMYLDGTSGSVTAHSGNVSYVVFNSPINMSASFIVNNFNAVDASIRLALVNSSAVGTGGQAVFGSNGYTNDTFILYDDTVPAQSSKFYSGDDSTGFLDVGAGQSVIWQSSIAGVNILMFREA